MYYKIKTTGPDIEAPTTYLNRFGGEVRIQGPRGTLVIKLQEDNNGNDIAVFRREPSPGGGGTETATVAFSLDATEPRLDVLTPTGRREPI
jgi:hypothetical protein